MDTAISPIKSTIFACLGTFVGQVSIFIYSPALLSIQKQFGVSEVAVQHTIAIFLVGYAIGMFCTGPLCERFTTRRILLVSLAFFSLFSFIASSGFSFTSLVLCRLGEGLCTGFIVSSTRYLMRTLMEDAVLAKNFASLSIVFALSAALAPLIGGFLTEHVGWQMNFVFIGMLSAFLFAFTYVLLPNNKVQDSVKLKEVMKNYSHVFKDKTFWNATILGSFVYGISMVFNAVGPYLYMKTLHFSSQEFGIYALIIAAGYLLGAFITQRFVIRFGQRAIMRVGLGLIFGAATFLVVCGVLKMISPALIAIPVFGAMCGQAMLFGNSMALALKPFAGRVTSYATSSLGFVQQVILGTLVYFCSFIPSQSLLPIGIVFLVIFVISIWSARGFLAPSFYAVPTFQKRHSS